MRSKGSSILISFIVIAVSASFCLAACPSADLTGDCFVDFNDFAVMAAQWPATDYDDVAMIAAQWITTDPCAPGDMVLIPGGTFEMGDSLNDGGGGELPVHTVTLDSFYMGRHEITNKQYCDYLNSAISRGLVRVINGEVYEPGVRLPGSYSYCHTGGWSQIDYSGGVFSVRTKAGRDMSNDPMLTVSWHGATAYCNWRSWKEVRHQRYNLSTWDCDFSQKGYRLPTEAEWEYAARGGFSGRRFPWGETISHSQANYYSYWPRYPYDVNPIEGYHPIWNDGVHPYTSPAGSFAANGYGLYGMAGNAWEWCNDWYDSGYYAYSPTNNPKGPTSGSLRIGRGCGWGNYAIYCRVASRLGATPRLTGAYCGFRIVLDLD